MAIVSIESCRASWSSTIICGQVASVTRPVWPATKLLQRAATGTGAPSRARRLVSARPGRSAARRSSQVDQTHKDDVRLLRTRASSQRASKRQSNPHQCEPHPVEVESVEETRGRAESPAECALPSVGAERWCAWCACGKVRIACSGPPPQHSERVGGKDRRAIAGRSGPAVSRVANASVRLE